MILLEKPLAAVVSTGHVASLQKETSDFGEKTEPNNVIKSRKVFLDNINAFVKMTPPENTLAVVVSTEYDANPQTRMVEFGEKKEQNDAIDSLDLPLDTIYHLPLENTLAVVVFTKHETYRQNLMVQSGETIEQNDAINSLDLSLETILDLPPENILAVIVSTKHVTFRQNLMVQFGETIEQNDAINSLDLSLESILAEEDSRLISEYDACITDTDGLFSTQMSMKDEGGRKKGEKNETGTPVVNVKRSIHQITRQETQGEVNYFRPHKTFLNRRTRCIYTFLLLTFVVVHVSGSKWSCAPSVRTMAFSKTCPMNEKEYIQRAKLKKCGNITQNCSTKIDFKYHCVIDTSGLKFVEVCAPQRSIFGYCTEFNKGGARVQEHYQYGCKNFTEKPCPDAYPSWKCYEYPGCYNHVMEDMKTTKQKNSSTDRHDIKRGSVDDPATFPPLEFLIVGLFISLGLTIFILWRFHKLNNTQEIGDPGDEKLIPGKNANLNATQPKRMEKKTHEANTNHETVF